jgi:hypothetical protein
MQNDRINLPLRSTGKIIAGYRRGEQRSESLLRRRKRKRSRLLRKA